MAEPLAPLWEPTDRRASTTRLHEFRSLVEKRGHGPFDGFASLHWFSVDQQAEFWSAV